MRVTRRTLQVSLALLTFALGSWTAAAKSVPLPLDRTPLRASTVELDLHDARIDVQIDDLAEPSLNVIPAVEPDAVAVVLVREERGGVQLVQPRGQEDQEVPLEVRLVVDPATRISIAGQGLDVTLVDRREELSDGLWSQLEEEVTLDRAKVMRPGGTAKRYSLELDDSAINLRRLTGASVSGRGNNVVLTRCRGPLVFDLESAELEVDEHWGALYFRGRDSGLQLDGVVGRMDLDLTECSVNGSGGRGSAQGELEGGSIILNGWNGSVTVEGQDALIDVRSLPSEQDFVTVRGAGNQLSAAGLAGALRVDLKASSVDARDVGGRVIVSADEASDLRLAELRDSVQVTLAGDSLLSLERVAGVVEGEVERSELQASRIEGAELSGRDAIVSLSGVSGSVEAEFADTIFDVESESRNLLEFQFRGDSDVRVGLPTPCLVRLEGAERGGNLPAGLMLGPCDAYDRRARRQFRGGPNPVTVRLSLQGEPEVEFWGR